jgi:transcriptional regulator with XRE-family HTH domain
MDGNEPSEWGWSDDQGGHDMPLGERIKELRTEHGWSQGELAEHVGGDARQISRYENGRITPSLDAVVRIAEVLNVSIDYLAIEDAPRRPLHVADHGVAERLGVLDELTDEDRASLLNVLDALVAKTRMKAIVGDIA